MILMCSIPGVALNVERINQAEMATVIDDVPVWAVDNSWGYDIDTMSFQLNRSGEYFRLDLTSDGILEIKVKGTTATSYLLSITGNLDGTFNYDDGAGINLGGTLFFTKVSGDIKIRKADLAAEETKITINTIAIIFDHPLILPIPIPVPLEITISFIPDAPRSLIDFPLFDGKPGLISEINLSTTIKADSIVLRILHIIRRNIPSEISFDLQVEIPILLYTAAEEQINVGGTTYTAYNIEYYLGLLGSIYYAPQAGNIVKASAGINTADIMLEFDGELKETTYT
jgi:hypothetical protein